MAFVLLDAGGDVKEAIRSFRKPDLSCGDVGAFKNRVNYMWTKGTKNMEV